MFKRKITLTASTIKLQSYLNAVYEKIDNYGDIKDVCKRIDNKPLKKLVCKPFAVYKLCLFSGGFSRFVVAYVKPVTYSVRLYRRYLAKRYNIKKRRGSFMDIVASNPDLLRFMTLTFADNVIDVAYANNRFNLFMTKLRKLLGGQFKYVCVIEFQERGAVHYHLLHNAKYLHSKALAHLWGCGFVQNKSVDVSQQGNACAYLSAYMTKASETEKLGFGKKAFHCSQNCVRPLIVTDSALNRDLFNSCLWSVDKSCPVYATEYVVTGNGRDNYCDVVVYRTIPKTLCDIISYFQIESNLPTPKLAELTLLQAPYSKPRIKITTL